MRKNHPENILIIAMTLSIFSQIDSIRVLLRPTMYVMWVVTLLVFILRKNCKICISSFSKLFLIIYSTYALLTLLFGVFNDNYFESGYFKVLLIPLFIVICVDNAPKEVFDNYEKIAKCFVIAALVFAISVQHDYINSYSTWLNSISYVYENKNSAAQIWSCAVFLIVFLIKPNKKWERVVWLTIGTYLLLIIGFSQCRTAILGICFGVAITILIRAKHKTRWIVAFSLFFIVIITIPETNEFINQALLLDRYDYSNLNDVSSGRLSTYSLALDAFLSSPIVGVGSLYVDCSYLLILAENGIVGFILIESIWAYRIFTIFKSVGFKISYGIGNFLITITCFYFVESLLEGYPPFGPGASALGFWLFTGLLTNNCLIIIANNQSRKINNWKTTKQ